VDLSQLGNIGEFFGGLAVIASLIFVGAQIRQNTRALKLAHLRGVTEGIRESLSAIVGDPELAAIGLRGFNDLASLDPVERYRFDLIMFGWLGQFELACEAHHEGFFPSDTLAPHRTVVAAWMSTPGGEAWWRERRAWFSKVGQNAVDDALTDGSLDRQHSGPPGA
jgi:hypothetical protein